MLEGQTSCLVSRAVSGSGDNELGLVYMNYRILDVTKGKRQCQTLDDSNTRADQSGDQSDTASLIPYLGFDMSVECFARCSRSDYWALSSLNSGFRSLLRSGRLYARRRDIGRSEHWVYFSCNVLEWEAFDPNRGRWIRLPRMPPFECFMCSDKESLAVGTQLLVFGKEVTSHIILKYSILTNTWSSGMRMKTPRCLFGSAGLGHIAIMAGGCDVNGNILSSAELYDSEKGTWESLPSMNKPRKMCSGFFMDGKFYVVGGHNNAESLTCGEVFDLGSKTWRVIENMAPARRSATEPPSLLAVVDNELYAADYTGMELRKYDKRMNMWLTLGRLPERAVSMNGWGLAFRACGHRLIVIGGPRGLAGGIIELNSWIPKDGPPEWEVLASKHSGSFVYNCAVMSC